MALAKFCIDRPLTWGEVEFLLARSRDPREQERRLNYLSDYMELFTPIWDDIIDFARCALFTPYVCRKFYDLILSRSWLQRPNKCRIHTTVVVDLLNLIEPEHRGWYASVFAEQFVVVRDRSRMCRWPSPDADAERSLDDRLEYDGFHRLEYDGPHRLEFDLPHRLESDGSHRSAALGYGRSIARYIPEVPQPNHGYFTPRTFYADPCAPAPQMRAAQSAFSNARVSFQFDATCAPALQRAYAVRRDEPRAQETPRPPASQSAAAACSSEAHTQETPRPPASLLHDCTQSDEEALDENDECVVCSDNVKRVVLIPCGHQCICIACTKALTPAICPMCRASVQIAAVVFK